MKKFGLFKELNLLRGMLASVYFTEAKKLVLSKSPGFEFDDVDRKFAKDVYTQIVAHRKAKIGDKEAKRPPVSGPNIMYTLYQLLGDKTNIDVKYKGGTKEIAKVTRKTEQPDGSLVVDLEFPPAGRRHEGKEVKPIRAVDIHVDIPHIKKKLAQAGLGNRIKDVLNIGYKTWEKNIKTRPGVHVHDDMPFDFKRIQIDRHSSEADADEIEDMVASGEIAPQHDMKKDLGKLYKALDIKHSVEDAAVFEDILSRAVKLVGSKLRMAGNYRGHGQFFPQRTLHTLPGITEEDFYDAVQFSVEKLRATLDRELSVDAVKEKLKDTDYINKILKKAISRYLNSTWRRKDKAVGCTQDDYEKAKQTHDPSILGRCKGDVETEQEPDSTLTPHENPTMATPVAAKQIARPWEKEISGTSAGRWNRYVPQPRQQNIKMTGSSVGKDDDLEADPEDIRKFRRGWKAEGFRAFVNSKIKEVAGATGAIYDGTKGKDFQWEGDPKSMIKCKKKKK